MIAQRLLARAVTEEEKDEALAAQFFSRSKQCFESMRESVRADVARNERAFETKFFRQRCVLRARLEVRQIDAVGNDFNLGRINAAANQNVFERLRDAHHARALAIEK